VSLPIPRTDLVGERLALQPYSEEFGPLLCAAARESTETVGQWLPWCHAEYDESRAGSWIAKCEAAWRAGEEYEFAFFDHTGEFVGAGGLNAVNRLHNFANLGYWVRQSRQREGIAVEAIGLLAQFGFHTVGLTRIEIVIAHDNGPSRRAAEKAGATFECLARNRLVLRGNPVVAAVYSLIPNSA
jgi:ribosomal-protein-serine acetyltransferase